MMEERTCMQGVGTNPIMPAAQEAEREGNLEPGSLLLV